MNNKDFLDKQFKVSENGKLYLYYSCIPNDKEERESPAKTDRGQTIFGIQKIERREEDGKLLY